MIIIKGISFKKIHGIALFPFILLKPKNPDLILLNHERIHIRQQIELLVLPFYIWYIAEWLYYFVQNNNWWQAYNQISFEKEAYQNENDLAYLEARKIWSFINYL